MIPISEIQKKYGNSMAVVILCTRTHFKTAEIGDLNTFIEENNIEWSDVFKTCRKHRIRILIYKKLLKVLIPDKIKNQINLELKSISIQNIKQGLETERLIELLYINGINAIPYKGISFSKQFYNDFNLRETGDIDLVINPNDLPKIFPLMKKEGFHSFQLEYYHRIGHKKYIETHKDFCYTKCFQNKREFLVEFHFNIINKSIFLPQKTNNFDINNCLEHKLINKKISFLNPSEHLRAVFLHHILQDQIGHLKTVIDLGQGLNMTEDLKINNTPNSEKKLQDALQDFDIDLIKQIINHLFGTQFKVSSMINSNETLFVKFILSNSYKKIRDNKFPILDGINFNYSNYKRTKKLYLKKEHRFYYTVKLLLSFITPQSIDYKLIKINKRFHFLYYIARPLRLIFNPQNPQTASNGIKKKGVEITIKKMP